MSNYQSKHTGKQIDAAVEKIVNNTANNGQVLTANGSGGVTWENPKTPSKADLGIGNVDNTADKDKPVSTAQQTAINTAKAQAKTEANSYTDQEILEIQSNVGNRLQEHNTSPNAHNDIRLLITQLAQRLNALADSDDSTLDQMSEIVAYIKANKTLIESVTTSKVNVSDIIDDLTTNVANKPLSASQGVVLKALIDGLSRDKLNATDLAVAITTALAQAKASGEFDGKDGAGGYTPQKGVDYFTEAEKQEIAEQAAKKIDTSKFVQKYNESQFGNEYGNITKTVSFSIAENYPENGYIEYDTTYPSEYYGDYVQNFYTIRYADEYIEHKYKYEVDGAGSQAEGSNKFFLPKKPTGDYTLATTADIPQSGGGGMKLTYLGNLANGTPTVNVNRYKGFAYSITLDIEYGMEQRVIYSGTLFKPFYTYGTDEYAYGIELRFPFNDLELYNKGVELSQFGYDDGQPVFLMLNYGEDSSGYGVGISKNPFEDAMHNKHGSGLESYVTISVDIYGIE